MTAPQRDPSPSSPLSPRERARERARIVPIVALVATAFILISSFTHTWPPARVLALSRGTGWIALWFLLAAVCATPLARVLSLFRASRHGALVTHTRRACGIASACFALVHAGYAFFVFLGAQTALFDWPHLRAGTLALLVLILLLLTSFPTLVARLRFRAWKELHRLAYVAAALVLLHVLLSPFADRRFVLGVYALVVLLGFARALPKPKPAAPHTNSGMPASRQNRSSTSQ